jgi:transposase
MENITFAGQKISFMEDNQTVKLYNRMLRLGDEWAVSSIVLDEQSNVLHITISYQYDTWTDKDTGEVFKLYDLRPERVWRHLDSMEFQTHVHCRLPRIKTSNGKVQTIEYDWAEEGFSYTKKFANHCILVLQATHNQQAAAKLVNISNDRMCGIMHASVERGLQRRDLSHVRKISLDEKSIGKGHHYITVLTDSSSGTVLDVEENRTQDAAERLLKRALNPDRLTCISTVCCDMWEAFMNALKKNVPMRRLCMINFMSSSI